MTRCGVSAVSNGFDQEQLAPTVWVDRCLLVSPGCGRDPGCRVVARSPGVRDAEARELEATLGDLGSRVELPGLERSPTSWLQLDLSSGRVCVGRVDHADLALGRPARAATCLVLSPDSYRAAFDSLPPTRLLRPLAPDRAPLELACLGLPAGGGRAHRPRVDETVARLLAARPAVIAALLTAADRGERVVVTSGAPLGDDLLVVLRLLSPAERRVTLTTTALGWDRLCERVAWVGGPRALLERLDPTWGALRLDWHDPGPFVAPAPRGSFAAEVERLLRGRDAHALRQLLFDQEARAPMSTADVQGYSPWLRARSALERPARLAPADVAAGLPGAVGHAGPGRDAELLEDLVLTALAGSPRAALLAARATPLAVRVSQAAFARLVVARRWLAALVLLADATPAERDRLAAGVEAWAASPRPDAKELAALAAGVVDLRAAGVWDAACCAVAARVLTAALSALEPGGRHSATRWADAAAARPEAAPSEPLLALPPEGARAPGRRERAPGLAVSPLAAARQLEQAGGGGARDEARRAVGREHARHLGAGPRWGRRRLAWPASRWTEQEARRSDGLVGGRALLWPTLLLLVGLLLVGVLLAASTRSLSSTPGPALRMDPARPGTRIELRELLELLDPGGARPGPLPASTSSLPSGAAPEAPDGLAETRASPPGNHVGSPPDVADGSSSSRNSRSSINDPGGRTP